MKEPCEPICAAAARSAPASRPGPRSICSSAHEQVLRTGLGVVHERSAFEPEALPSPVTGQRRRNLIDPGRSLACDASALRLFERCPMPCGRAFSRRQGAHGPLDEVRERNEENDELAAVFTLIRFAERIRPRARRRN